MQQSTSHSNHFLHKQIFQANAMVWNCHKPRDTWALEHMAYGRVIWKKAKKYDNVSISIVNVHQATANWHDLQRQVNHLLRVMIDAAQTQRLIMGGDFNAALSRHGYDNSSLRMRHMTRWTTSKEKSCLQSKPLSSRTWLRACMPRSFSTNAHPPALKLRWISCPASLSTKRRSLKRAGRSYASRRWAQCRILTSLKSRRNRTRPCTRSQPTTERASSLRWFATLTPSLQAS